MTDLLIAKDKTLIFQVCIQQLKTPLEKIEIHITKARSHY